MKRYGYVLLALALISVASTAPAQVGADGALGSGSIIVSDASPYFENFEAGAGGWTSPGLLWELGTPSQTAIASAFSGTNAWMTDLDANYIPSTPLDTLEASFDFSGLTSDPVFSFQIQYQTEADWDAVVDPNLKGCWLVATEAARRMVEAGKGGSIVNIASILGERVGGGVAPYAVSKAGVLQLTKALALELARHDIRVNALLPGYVVTDLNRDFLGSEAGDKLRMRIPSRRFSELSDLDGPLLLLASGAGGAMSGASVAVDRAHLVSGL